MTILPVACSTVAPRGILILPSSPTATIFPLATSSTPRSMGGPLIGYTFAPQIASVVCATDVCAPNATLAQRTAHRIFRLTVLNRIQPPKQIAKRETISLLLARQ